MDKIITIGRELGSGGRTIGKLISKNLGIPYYDREIIDAAAAKSGLAASFIEQNEQKITNGMLYQLGMGVSYGFTKSLSEQVYTAQANVINELADKGACVIVGRCADYILRDRKNLFRVFVYSDKSSRIKRAIESYGLTEQTAKKEIQKSDKERARHYSLFTDQTWGERSNYDLMLNSGVFGIEKCADAICSLIGK